MAFRTALTDAWAQVTQAANWMVTELYARDIRRRDQAAMPPMPRAYLYPEARRQFPRLAPLTVASLEHTTQALYRATYAIACKMCVWLRRPPQPDTARASGVLQVQTAVDALLVAVDADDQPWSYHGDHLRRWAAEYRKIRLHFAGDDQHGQGSAPRFADRRTVMPLKYHHRIRSAVQEAAAHVVSCAQRRRRVRIQYDDTVRTFCPEFPFAALRERLRMQCDPAGIRLEYMNDEQIASANEAAAAMS